METCQCRCHSIADIPCQECETDPVASAGPILRSAEQSLTSALSLCLQKLDQLDAGAAQELQHLHDISVALFDHERLQQVVLTHLPSIASLCTTLSNAWVSALLKFNPADSIFDAKHIALINKLFPQHRGNDLSSIFDPVRSLLQGWSHPDLKHCLASGEVNLRFQEPSIVVNGRIRKYTTYHTFIASSVRLDVSLIECSC